MRYVYLITVKDFQDRLIHSEEFETDQLLVGRRHDEALAPFKKEAVLKGWFINCILIETKTLER